MSDGVSTPDPRQRLLDAAEELFAARGYEGASVRDICERAGMNVAAVNYHFRDKERLYVEALKRAHCCVDGDEMAAPAFPPGTKPADRLRLFLGMMVARMHTPARPTAMQLLMREMAHPSTAGEEVILQYIRPKAFALRDILAALLPDADPHRLLMIGFSVIGQVLFYRQNRPVVELIFGKQAVAELDAAAVTEHVTRFTLAALGKGPKYRPADPPARSEEPSP
jgi:AcrR family transcriptional regulator